MSDDPTASPRAPIRRDHRIGRIAPRLVLLLAATTLSTGAACIWLLLARNEARTPDVLERSLRERAAALVSTAGGIWDSHPDPDIGRVLMAGLDGRRDVGVAIHSNRMGVREASYPIPKPESVVRVVFLGDSMIFGHRMPEEQRVGVHLARFLAPAVEAAGKSVECLHLGITAWNLRAACAFLRRQVSLLRPDVVLHVTIGNDLDDNPSVRGFGAMADFTDQWRSRAGGTICSTHPRFLGAGPRAQSPLHAAIDFEGRSRFQAAAQEISRLRDSIVASGGRYLLIVVDPRRWPAAMDYFDDVLAKDEIAYLPRLESEMHLEAGDLHWNQHGMQRVAEYCYGLLRSTHALGKLDLPSRHRFEQCFSSLNAQAAMEAAESRVRREFEDLVGSEIIFDGKGRSGVHQVHGGIVAPGLVLPYASMILRSDGGRSLVIQGERLRRPELRGGVEHVYVDEVLVGQLSLANCGCCGDRSFEHTFVVPDRVGDRKFVSVRMVADDWVLQGEDLRECVCFRIERIALSR